MMFIGWLALFDFNIKTSFQTLKEQKMLNKEDASLIKLLMSWNVFVLEWDNC